MAERRSQQGETEEVRFQALVRAMTDPVRSKLLFAVADSTTGVTVRQLSARIKEPSRKVRYHVDALVKQGLLSVASERPKRGVIERSYEASQPQVIPSEAAKNLSTEQLQKAAMQILKAVLVEAGAAMAAKTFWHEGFVEVRIPGDVDTQGWWELAEIHEHALEKIQTVMAESGERLASSGDERMSAVSVLLLFRAPEWPS